MKTKYDTDKSELENKIPDTSGFTKKADYNTKLTDVEGKIPDVSGLVTKTALTTVENKIPDVSSLVKKTDYDTNVTEIENKLNNHNDDEYIYTPEFNKFSAEVFDARLARAHLVTKTNFDNNISNLNNKIEENRTLNVSFNRILKNLRKKLDLTYFNGKRHF